MAAGGTVASDPGGAFTPATAAANGGYGRKLLGQLLVYQSIGGRIHHQVEMSEKINTNDGELHIC